MAADSITMTETTTEQPSQEESQEKPSKRRAARTNSKSKSKSTGQTRSKSPNSASDSKPRANDKRIIRRTGLKKLLSRDPKFRGLEESDFRWLWAAYKKDSFPKESFPEGLPKEEFDERVRDYLSRFHEWYLLSAEKPVGVVMILTDGYRFEPHVKWFSWATPRQKMETAGKFLNIMRHDGFLGVIYMSEGESKFMEHLEKRGIVRMVGKVLDFFGLHRHANFYQTSRRDLI